MKKFLKYTLMAVIALVFIGTFIFLYQKSSTKVATYDVYTATTSNIKKTSILTGTIEPRDEILIKPQISGIIAELYKEAGEMVKAGEVIAKVKVIPDMGQLNSAESRVTLAKINLTQATNDYQRTEKLYREKLVSQEEFEKSRQAYLQAKEEVNSSTDALQIVKEGVSKSNAAYSTTLIRSTIDGLILDIPVKVGNSVTMSNTFNDGTTIATVANMRSLIFKGYVDETEVGQVHTGMEVKVMIGALSGRDFPAKIEFIAPKVSTATANANQFELKAAIDIPQDVKIRAGYSANAEIIIDSRNAVITIPEGAVEYADGAAFVYKLTKEEPQTFERVRVTVGLSDGVNIEVKSGLKAGNKIRGNVKEEDNNSKAQ